MKVTSGEEGGGEHRQRSFAAGKETNGIGALGE